MKVQLGLGIVPGEWSFFHENDWNYHEDPIKKTNA